MRGRVFVLLMWFLFSFEVQGQRIPNIAKAVKVGTTFKFSAPPNLPKRIQSFTMTAQIESSNNGLLNIKGMEPNSTSLNYPRLLQKNDRIRLTFEDDLLQSSKNHYILIEKPEQELIWDGNDTTVTWKCLLYQPFPSDVNDLKTKFTVILNDEQNPLFVLNSKVTLVEKEDSDSEIGEKTKTKYTKKPLFYLYKNDVEGETTRRRKEFLSFLKEKGYLADSTFRANRRDVISMSFVSFYKQWRLCKKVPPIGSGYPAACFRFLTEDCGLKCLVSYDQYLNFIRGIINPSPKRKRYRDTERVKESIDEEVRSWMISHGTVEQ